jgi:hypothetical protein
MNHIAHKICKRFIVPVIPITLGYDYTRGGTYHYEQHGEKVQAHINISRFKLVNPDEAINILYHELAHHIQVYWDGLDSVLKNSHSIRFFNILERIKNESKMS